MHSNAKIGFFKQQHKFETKNLNVNINYYELKYI